MNIINIIISNIILLIPLFLSVVFTFIFILPFIPFEITSIAPLLGIMTAIYWIVNRPELMSWASVLIVGLIHDFLLGLTVGLSCLSLVIVRYVIIKLLYKYDNLSSVYTFLFIALGVSLWLLCILVLKTIIQFEFFNYMNVIFQYLLSLTFSPIIIIFNNYISNKIKQ